MDKETSANQYRVNDGNWSESKRLKLKKFQKDTFPKKNIISLSNICQNTAANILFQKWREMWISIMQADRDEHERILQ